MHFTGTAEVENVVHGKGSENVQIFFRSWNIVKFVLQQSEMFER